MTSRYNMHYCDSWTWRRSCASALMWWLQLTALLVAHFKSTSLTVTTVRLAMAAVTTSRATTTASEAPNPQAQVARKTSLRIVMFSVFVGETPLNVTGLNHFQYAQKRGYTYEHIYFTPHMYAEKYGHDMKHSLRRAAWLSVLAVRDILWSKYPSNATHDTVFFKADLDCLFARSDLGLETFIASPQHSFITTQSHCHTFFATSHTWFVKHDAFGKAFIDEWLDYINFGTCADAAVEQGALQLTMATMASTYHKKNVSEYPCSAACNSLRDGWGHHQCVAGWVRRNNLTAETLHPRIKVYPCPNVRNSTNSPEDGFTFVNLHHLIPDSRPLTIHPCKDNVYADPDELMKKWHQFCVITANIKK